MRSGTLESDPRDRVQANLDHVPRVYCSTPMAFHPKEQAKNKRSYEALRIEQSEEGLDRLVRDLD